MRRVWRTLRLIWQQSHQFQSELVQDQEERLKHVETRTSWVQDHAERGRVAIKTIEGKTSPADLWTKYLRGAHMKELLVELPFLYQEGEHELAPQLQGASSLRSACVPYQLRPQLRRCVQGSVETIGPCRLVPRPPCETFAMSCLPEPVWSARSPCDDTQAASGVHVGSLEGVQKDVNLGSNLQEEDHAARPTEGTRAVPKVAGAPSRSGTARTDNSNGSGQSTG